VLGNYLHLMGCKREVEDSEGLPVSSPKMVFACRCVVLALSLILVSTTSRIDDTCTSTETSVSLLGQQRPILPQQASLKKPFRRHIVAIGDLHGDMENAKRVLEFSGVVDENLDWSGKVDMLVQTGDIIDR
jgi:hypothetical protein